DRLNEVEKLKIISHGRKSCWLLALNKGRLPQRSRRTQRNRRGLPASLEIVLHELAARSWQLAASFITGQQYRFCFTILPANQARQIYMKTKVGIILSIALLIG